MNDEIKECLDSLYYQDDYSSISYDKLLDYITNLQQENEYLKKNNPEQNIEHFRIIKENKRKINNLREENKTLQENNQAMQEEMARVWEENERLKETNVYCNRTDCIGRIKDSRKYDSIYQEKEDYKSRCEKADNQLKIIMQIIKEQPTRNVEDDEWLENRLIGVVNILQGENNGN